MRNVSIKILLFIGALTILSCSSRNNHLEHNNFIQIDLSCRKSQFPLSSFIYDIYAIKLELPTPYFFWSNYRCPVYRFNTFCSG